MKTFIDFQKEEVELDESTHRIGDYITYGPSGSNGGRIINKTATHVIVQPTNRDISDKIENKDITRNHRTNPITGHMKKEEVELEEVATPIKNKVQDRKTGKWYDPTKEFNKLMDKPEVKAQMKRMAKTDVKEEAELDEEQLDELSKDTLASYEKKSRVAAHKHALASELKGLAADPAGSYAHKQMADKRHAGWKVAVKKLHTEESELDVESIDEGRPSQQHPLEGHDYHRKTNAELEYIAKDAHKAAEAMKSHNTTAENKYRDQASDSATVRHFRKTSGTPDWYKKKYGHVKEAVEPKDNKPPFEGPYKQSKGTVTDKSGAKHTPLSNVRSLARNAIEKMKQKMRMAHLSPEVRAEKLARNEELVGGQKKLDIDKDGKIEKSDLEVLRAKKLKEDVTTAAQKLKAALDRHTEHAVAANRAGDHDAVKVHQGYANKIKTQLGKLAKNEEVELDEEQLDEGSQLFDIGHVNDKTQRMTYKYTMADNAKHAIEKSKNKKGHTLLHVYNNEKGTFHDPVTGKRKGDQFEEVEIDEAGPMMDLPNPDRTDKLGASYNPHRKGLTASDLARITKGKASVSKEKPGQLRKPNPPSTRKATVSSLMKMLDQMGEEVEIDEAAPVVISTKKPIGFRVSDVGPGGKESNVKTDKTWDDTQKEKKSTQIKEAEMTDAEMAKREKIVKGMKKSFKDFTTKYGDRAKEVMYATATKKAMEEEVEEELEEDMDEGVTTRNGAVTVHKGTYGTSYQPNDDEDDEDTPEKKEPAVKRGRGRPAGAKSGAKPKGSAAGKSYGGVAIHSLRLPNNNK